MSIGEVVASDNSDGDDEWTEEDGGIRLGGMVVPPAPPPHCSLETSGPRLIITHIMNENFKSYAGRVMLGPFHKCFTSIIGPNGSGKSNVIDSMLFVFGYRATKIRSKKISVLLHKSEKHKNVRSCTVEVHFIRINDLVGDDYQIIPNSELVVARTAFADNSSYYAINGKKSQFKEVANILRLHGIDLIHNRFLILQGEVEQISLMKPKAQTEHDTGMLEYLEDIIGTTRFKKPINELGIKVEQLTEERTERLNRVKSAEKDLDVLKEPLRDAIEFLKIENKKTVVQNTRYQKQIFDLENKLKGLEQLKEEKDKKMEEIKEILKDAQEKRSKKEKEMSVKHKEIEMKGNQKEKLSEAFRKIENRATQLKEEIIQTNKRRKKAIESKKQEEAKILELEAIPVKNTNEIEELTAFEKRLEMDKQREQAFVEETISNLSSETKELQELKISLTNELIDLCKNKDEARSSYNIAESELEIYLSTEQKEIAKLEKLKESLQKTTDQLKHCKLEMTKLESKIPEAERQLQADQAELDIITTEEPKVMQELRRLTVSLDVKQRMMQAITSRNKVLSYVMQQKQLGRMPGVYGRLGDLGGIDSKYDVAISTACGPLDYIVVDSVDTGTECVRELKSCNIGRANFIALEKQEHLRNVYKRPIKTPENVPRLFDLITVEDDRVKPAFYFALRDTLVATDMDQAIRVAYGTTRYRVVTLTGEIIEIAGTMSGGGNQTLRGRMGRNVTLTTSNQLNENQCDSTSIEELENQVSELQEKQTGYLRRQTQLETSIMQLKRNLQTWNMDYATFKIEVDVLSTQEPALLQQVMDQEDTVKEIAPDPMKVSEMRSKVDELKKVFERESASSETLELEVSKISTKIQEITSGKMKAAQSKLDAVIKKLDKVRSEMTRLKVAINTSIRNLTKTKGRLESYTLEIKEAEASLKKADTESQQYKKEGSELTAKIEILSDEILTSEQVIDSLRSEISHLVKEQNRISTLKLNEDQEMERSVKAIQETKASLPHLKKKLAALKLHEIPSWLDSDIEYNTVVPAPERIQLTPESLEEIDLENLLYRITNYDEILKGMKPNLRALDDYKDKAAQLKHFCSELDDATKRRNEMRKNYDELRKARLKEFMVGFTIISNKLKEMYQMITLGGDAEFELIDSLDPFSEGVIFSVRPPKKSWKEISNLSGGEKTLSSLALVFALHYYRPSPLYVMDEIDAALDFKNVSIVGNYIKERTKNAQFIIISLRSNMFELADVLVGVYKTFNCTRSITITPGVYETQSPVRTEGIDEDDDSPPSIMSKRNRT